MLNNNKKKYNRKLDNKMITKNLLKVKQNFKNRYIQKYLK